MRPEQALSHPERPHHTPLEMAVTLPPPHALGLPPRPPWRALLIWTGVVLGLHLGLLLSIADNLPWTVSAPDTARAGPMQIRWLPSPSTSTPPATQSATQSAIPSTMPAAVPPQDRPPAKAPAVAPSPPAPAQTLKPSAAQPLPDTREAPAGSPLAPSEPATPTPAARLEPALQTAEPNPPPPQTEEAPTALAATALAWPELSSDALPPSALLRYRLQGQEKGMNYQASAELRWQRHDSDYAMSLSIRAFLLGTRHWRSVGQIGPAGLAPTRFSDSWRSERAAHFDRPQQRIVFSSNAPTVPLQAGAQDQVSLYAQLAAVMATHGARLTPGSRLEIQTATVRDALPWLLTLEKAETLQLDGQSLNTLKWVGQRRHRFDAQVEFWASAAHDWLPARIRITQTSGNFIDLQLAEREALPVLPPAQ